MANDIDHEALLKELSVAVSCTVEQLRAAFALHRIYKRRLSKLKGV